MAAPGRQPSTNELARRTDRRRVVNECQFRAADVKVSAPDTDRFGFSRFASHPFFEEVNRWLVERVASLGSRFVDLAVGPGAVTELIVQAMRDRGRGLVYAVDPSLSELERAKRRIASSLVEFIQGSAENLSRLVPQVDVVVFATRSI